MWKIKSVQAFCTTYKRVKYNMGSVKAGKAKTLSFAFFNIVHYGFLFNRRLDSFAKQRKGIQAKDCQSSGRCLQTENENNNCGI